jgi:hypothetical protein
MDRALAQSSVDGYKRHLCFGAKRQRLTGTPAQVVSKTYQGGVVTLALSSGGDSCNLHVPTTLHLVKVASTNTLQSMLPWTSAPMDTLSAPPVSVLAALGLLTLLAYKSWLSYEQEKVRTREKLPCGCLSSFRSIRNFVVWRFRKSAHVLGYGQQDGPGVLIFCAKHFGMVRIARYASSFTKYRSCLARPTSNDFVGYSSHLPKLSSPATVGARNIGTTSPKNLKAVLDTQHKGTVSKRSKCKTNVD